MILDMLVKKLLVQGSRVVMFSQMMGMHNNNLEDHVEMREYNHCRIDGNMRCEECNAQTLYDSDQVDFQAH